MSHRHLGSVDFKKLQWVFVDVDGVLTDGGIILSGNNEFKRYDAKDGHGLAICRRHGLKVGILTGRLSDSVSRRAKELHLDHCAQGKQDKLSGYLEMKDKLGFEDDHVAYIGDDLQDAPVLKLVGYAATSCDGVADLDSVVHERLSHNGGYGAVREFCETILKGRGQWDDVLSSFGI